MANSNHPEVPAVKLLDRWLEKKRMSAPQFAKLIKREPQMVHAWRYRRAHPKTLDVLAIQEVTGISAEKWLSKIEARRLRQIGEEYEAQQAAKEAEREARLNDGD